jgi:hypothetical protein
MKRSSTIGIKLLLFTVITLLFVWALIAYSAAHRKSGGGTTGNDSSWGDRKRIEKTFVLKSSGSFVLSTDIGEVTVDGWDREEVSFNAEIRGEPRFVQDFTLTYDTTSQRIVITGKYEHHRWFFDIWNDADVHFTIKVPRQCSVDVQTSGGDVSMTSLQGNERGATSGGSVTASDIKGTTVLTTSGGPVRAKNVEGSCEAKTSGGSIKMQDVRGSTLANTSGGGIDLVDVEGKIDAHTSGGSIYVRLQSLNEGVSLRTSGGSITLEVPSSVSADLDAATSGGSVRCDLPITVKGKTDDDELSGKINGGGNTILLRSSGGNINIRNHQ